MKSNRTEDIISLRTMIEILWRPAISEAFLFSFVISAVWSLMDGKGSLGFGSGPIQFGFISKEIFAQSASAGHRSIPNNVTNYSNDLCKSNFLSREFDVFNSCNILGNE